MAGQEHEPGNHRITQAALCPGNSSRHFRYPGKETPDDLSGGRTTETGGFAPYASRFTNGGYIHGVPVNAPRKTLIEFSPSLGTTPRSHMCVRNATSHAKFIYDWAPIEETLVFDFR